MSFFLLCCDYQAEKNLALEDQLLHALQQNEDFRVRIDNYQSLIQYGWLYFACVDLLPCYSLLVSKYMFTFTFSH